MYGCRGVNKVGRGLKSYRICEYSSEGKPRHAEEPRAERGKARRTISGTVRGATGGTVRGVDIFSVFCAVVSVRSSIGRSVFCFFILVLRIIFVFVGIFSFFWVLRQVFSGLR